MDFEKAKEVAALVEKANNLSYKIEQIKTSRDLRTIIFHIEDENRSNGLNIPINLENIRYNTYNSELRKINIQLESI